MNELSLQVQGVSKQYRLGRSAADSLSDLVSQFFRRDPGLREPNNSKTSPTTLSDMPTSAVGTGTFWALNDVTFDVPVGEVFGIVGRNGAGKSTLLKIISRVTLPTAGRIDIVGRVASLLEVGTGFHPDLTGRENIFMNATLLGMTRREVNRRLDEIVEFAGVGPFLDTPVKRYSSGMRVRLGFSVAAHLEAEILVIDEVLTVGDAEFQKKCLGKMQTVATSGRTVLFVSHNMGAVRRLCSRGLLLENGRVVGLGAANAIVNQYLSLSGQADGSEKRWSAEDVVRFDGQPCLQPALFAARDVDGQIASHFGTDQPICLTFDFRSLQSIVGIRIGVRVSTEDNVVLFGTNTTLNADAHESLSANQHHHPAQQFNYRVACVVPANLLNQGAYKVDLGIDRPPTDIGTILEQECLTFHVVDTQGHGASAEKLPGVIRPAVEWRTIRQGES